MTWLMGDGFDFYDESGAYSQIDIGKTGSVWSVAGCRTTTTTRYGKGAAASMGDFNLLTSVPFTNSKTIWLNFAGMANGAIGGSGFQPNNGGTQEVGFEIKDLNAIQCTVSFTKNGNMILRSGAISAGSILATSAVLPQLTNGTWNHFQIKLVIDQTAGSIDVRLNGDLTSAFSASNINTRNGSSNAYCNKLTITTPNSSFYGYFVDDLYIFNDQGTDTNTWQGDVRAIQSMPDGDISTMWLPSSGANNWSRVNAGFENQDVDYVYSNSVSDKDLYSTVDIPTSYPIVCVQPKMYHRQDDAGPHLIAFQLKSGATTVTGASGPVTSSYNWLQQPYTLDPNTAAQWTSAAVNAAQIGPINIE